jgi:hypothetical protein
MVSQTKQQVWEAFQSVAGRAASAPSGGGGALVLLESQDPAAADALKSLTAASQQQTQAITNNTQVLAAGSAAGSQVQSIFTSGFGVAPLITGLIDLFTGGGGTTTPAPPVRYVAPPAVAFLAANTPTGIQDADYGPYGQVRTYAGDTASRLAGAGAAPQITIQVQAMDSRSFMDHSVEIAQAVREAMLNSHAINDVVADL